MEVFTISEQTPLYALTVGQFKEMLWRTAAQAQPVDKGSPEVIGKKECSELTGYSLNTINKLVCEHRIPYYKSGGRVLFKRQEVLDWLLRDRRETTAEYCTRKDDELLKRGARK